MKNKIILFMVLVLGSAFLFTGCTKEETKPAVTSGGLIVKAKLANSTGFLKNVNIGLATSQDNLDNSVYLQDLKSDANGNANFGQLNPGNYYYDCFTTVAGTDYYGEGQVQIVKGTDLTLTLVLEED